MKSYTQEQLNKAFTLVQNKDNWKMPVNAKIDINHPDIGGDLELISDAVIHFTGSIPTIKLLKNPNVVFVKATGYYNAIGA